MASSKMVVSSTNSDLPHRESSICSLSTLMADDDDQNDKQQSMTMDDILKNIYNSTTTNDMDDNNHHHAEPRTVDEAAPEEMTLEDFLTRAGAVREDDVTVGAGGVPIGYGQFQVQPPPAPAQGQEAPLDKATQQKQRRMIKNRESAARSRERKQAYTVELESLVTQLEEENARLVREEAEQKKERFKRLMENLIPIVEQRRPPRVLRRVHSVHW
ncbi:G-box-binding factor 4 [Prunus yedoensis var. nudiflora]|uniref:G-box-binding factor 4 n=1 Tax=Prunus yedoensis var. nudiflora TaxID=2094558 RepID=A0A314UG17_PRUYE|nr:G-box-binding factor 4 [Prunus yedoensis var. nudiflora]